MTTRTLAEYRARLQDILEGVTYGVALDCPVCQADAAKTRALLETLPNVRFRIFENDGYVTLTLKPGQTLEYSRFSRDDEGWTRYGAHWYYDDAERVIRHSWGTDGTDCDGRHSEGRDLVCPIDRLTAYTNGFGDQMPEWTKTGRWQRDYAAEAAGY